VPPPPEPGRRGSQPSGCPDLADDPTDMILDGPASRELGPVIAEGARNRA